MIYSIINATAPLSYLPNRSSEDTQMTGSSVLFSIISVVLKHSAEDQFQMD